MDGRVPIEEVSEVRYAASGLFVGIIDGGIKFPVPLQAVVIDEEGVRVELESFIVPFVSGIAGDAAKAGGAQDIFPGDDIQCFYFLRVVVEDAVGGYGYAVEQDEGFAVVESGVCRFVEHDDVEVAAFAADVDLAYVFTQYFLHGREAGIVVEVISVVRFAIEGDAIELWEAVAAEAIAGVYILHLHPDAVPDEKFLQGIWQSEGG